MLLAQNERSHVQVASEELVGCLGCANMVSRGAMQLRVPLFFVTGTGVLQVRVPRVRSQLHVLFLSVFSVIIF